MKKRSEILVIILLITYSSIFLSTLGFLTRLLVAIYFSITRGGFYFDASDFILSVKAGTGAGATLGIGLWILDKIHKNQPTDKT